MTELEKLSVVALFEDLPAKGLKRGQVGTIVEDLAPGVYEVEFSFRVADGTEAVTSRCEASGPHKFVAVPMQNAAEGDDSRCS